jgi:PAS domain S-box-containing protein
VAIVTRLYLAVGVLTIALYVAIGGSTLIFEGVGQAGMVAAVIGILRNRPAQRGGWWLFALGNGLVAGGDIIYFGYPAPAPFPSPADALYLTGVLVLVAAMGSLSGGRRALWRDPYSVTDAAALSFAIGYVLWSLFFGGALGAGAGLSRVVSAAYPVTELMMLTVVVRMALIGGRRSVSYYLVVVSVVLLVLSDAWYIVPALSSHYIPGTWRDIGWLGSYLAAGGAALHPSMRRLGRRRTGTVPVRRVALLGGSLVVVIVGAALRQAFDGGLDIYVFAGCAGGMAALITVRIAGLVRDVERARAQAQASERRFRLVFEHSPVGISIGKEGMMTETNPAFQRMLGFSGDELARMHYTDVTHPDDRRLKPQLELDENSRDAFTVDKRYRRKDGGFVEAHAHVSRHIDDGLGASLIEDVTGQRELEEQLRQSQKMEAVGKLAGGIAHDFNNLMTAVLGYSDLVLGRMPQGDANRAALGEIRGAAVRASDLTRQLLAFGRRQTLLVADVDLRMEIARSEALLGRVIGDDVVLRTALGIHPVLVRADSSQLGQVVMNLAVNARDAMPAGGTLAIAVRQDGPDAVLEVSDTGVGMDAQTRARIFEPFFTTKPVGQGTGLGLSTVEGIVAQSGGTVQVESAPGHGATFTVRLPLVEAAKV